MPFSKGISCMPAPTPLPLATVSRHTPSLMVPLRTSPEDSRWCSTTFRSSTLPLCRACLFRLLQGEKRKAPPTTRWSSPSGRCLLTKSFGGSRNWRKEFQPRLWRNCTFPSRTPLLQAPSSWTGLNTWCCRSQPSVPQMQPPKTPHCSTPGSSPSNLPSRRQLTAASRRRSTISSSTSQAMAGALCAFLLQRELHCFLATLPIMAWPPVRRTIGLQTATTLLCPISSTTASKCPSAAPPHSPISAGSIPPQITSEAGKQARTPTPSFSPSTALLRATCSIPIQRIWIGPQHGSSTRSSPSPTAPVVLLHIRVAIWSVAVHSSCFAHKCKLHFAWTLVPWSRQHVCQSLHFYFLKRRGLI